MDYEVSLQTVAACPTAVVAQATTWAEFPRIWVQLLDQVYAFLRGGGAAQDGLNIMLYRDDVPNVEVGVQVAGRFTPAGRVVPSALPAGQVATTVQLHGTQHSAVHKLSSKSAAQAAPWLPEMSAGHQARSPSQRVSTRLHRKGQGATVYTVRRTASAGGRRDARHAGPSVTSSTPR